MFGASRCSRTLPFQFDGPPALRADLPFSCDFSTHFVFSAETFSRYVLPSFGERGAILEQQVWAAFFCALS
jgi:hypothetical protein